MVEASIGLVWEQPEPAAVVTPTPLSRPAIVASGIRLADAGGLADVSIRKVAGDLGAGPMRLYRFVPSKDDLLDLMAEEVYAEIAARLHGPRSWREDLHEIASAYRAASFRHPWLVDLLGGRLHVGPHALAVLEATAAAIGRAPRHLTSSELWSALGAVNAYLFGAIRSDVVDPRPGPADSAGPMGNEAGPYLRRQLESNAYPALRRLADEAERPDPEADFMWGLDLMLNGLLERT